MKKHSYGKLINMSWKWMIQILFRPFDLKKWIMLAIIILLAGQMGGGSFNFNLGGDRADLGKITDGLRQKTPITLKSPNPSETSITSEELERMLLPQNTTPRSGVVPQIPQFLKDPKTIVLVSIIAIVILLFIGAFILLWMWINANFSFVFIDSIMRNDASLRVPFHRNKPQGKSYFRWNIVFSSIALLVFGGIIYFPIAQLAKAGAFAAKPPINPPQILLMLLGYIPALLITGILFFVVAFFTANFVLPIMYKKKIGILKAWGVFLGLLKRNIGEMLLYILVKIGLSILAFIAAILLTIIGVIALLLIVGVVGLLGWLIYAITPAVAKPVIAGIFLVVGIPAAVFLIFLFNLIFLPIPIFFRIFSICVLGSIDESLDLFAAKTPEEITAEGDDAKYKKSMRLVWFTVLLPILLALLGLLLAVTVPNFMRAREGLQTRGFGIEDIVPPNIVPPAKTPAISDSPIKKIIPSRKIVTVYLTNGNSFKAEIDSESEDNIAFRINGGTFILPRSDILRIEHIH